MSKKQRRDEDLSKYMHMWNILYNTPVELQEEMLLAAEQYINEVVPKSGAWVAFHYGLYKLAQRFNLLHVLSE